MNAKEEKAGVELTGQRQKALRQWLGLALPQFAELTPESTATHSRREQQDAPLTGPTGAVVLVLDYLYGLRAGPEQARVEKVRALLVNDPTRRHFIGRFGAAALVRMMEEAGLPIVSLSERIQAWCAYDHKQTIERTAAPQLQKTIGLSRGIFTEILGTAVGAITWAWIGRLLAPSGSPKAPATKKSSAAPEKARVDSPKASGRKEER
jgi:hypothetical protein